MSDQACEKFDDFYDGWLVDDDLDRYRDHLQRCPTCQEKLRLQKWLDEQLVGAAGRCVPPPAMATRASNWHRFGRFAAAISAVALAVAVLTATVLRLSPDDVAIPGPAITDLAIPDLAVPGKSEEEVVQVPPTPVLTVSVETNSTDYIALVDASIDDVTFVQLYPIIIHATTED